MKAAIVISSEIKRFAQDNDAYRAAFKGAALDQFSGACFNSHDEGAGITDAALLEKPTDLSAAQALAQLWARDLIANEGWDNVSSEDLQNAWDKLTTGPVILSEFHRLLEHGAFSAIAPTEGRKHVKDLLDRVKYDLWQRKKLSSGKRATYPDYQVTLYGKITCPNALHERLIGAEYLSAYAIATEWNITSFFFETPRDFGYVNWGTSA